MKAFTLIELLVVVTIIVVLLALLTPALDKAVASAEAVVCASNLRITHQAFTFYQQDFRRTWIAPWDIYNNRGGNAQALPPNDWYNAGVGVNANWHWQWPYVMAFYVASNRGKPTSNPAMGDGTYGTVGSNNRGSAYWLDPTTAKPMFCPTLLGQQRVWSAPTAPRTTWAYGTIAPSSDRTYDVTGARETGVTQGYDITGYPRVTRFVSPQTTVHLQDMAWLGNTAAPGIKQEIAPNAWANYNSIAIDPHLSKTNYVFCDGHVERLAHRWSEGPEGNTQAVPGIDRQESDLRKDAYRAY